MSEAPQPNPSETSNPSPEEIYKAWAETFPEEAAYEEEVRRQKEQEEDDASLEEIQHGKNHEMY